MFGSYAVSLATSMTFADPAISFEEPAFWIQLASLAALVLIAVGVWVLVVHMRETRDEAKRLAGLEGIESKLARLLADREDLDLRRLEHVLLDLREIQERTETSLSRLFEENGSRSLPPVGDSDVLLEELARARLLALGYTSIEIVGRPRSSTGGASEFLVEAVRDGARFKGSVRSVDGRITRVEMAPEYTAFP